MKRTRAGCIPATNCREQCRRSSSRQADCQVQVKTRAFEEKVDCVMRSMRLTPKQDVDGELSGQ